MKPRFLLDGMLGSLTSWLRICGFDTAYHKDMNDDFLITEAKKGNRILLTKDKQLLERSKKFGVKAYYVLGDNIIMQLSFLCVNLGITLTPSSSRCSKCNAEIILKDKNNFKNRVSENTYRNYDEFWVCNSCDKIYWKGSHWKKILETLSLAQRECEQNL